MNVLPWHQNPAICKRCRLGIEKCGFRQSKKQGERTAVKKAVLPFFLALQWLQRCSLAFWPFGLLAFWPFGLQAAERRRLTKPMPASASPISAKDPGSGTC